MKLQHAIWSLLVIPYLISAQPQAPMTSIRGTVVDSASGAPIADAEVRLSKTGQPLRRATTDAGGVFGFTDLEAGLYAMSATRAGYLEQAYGNSPDWQFRSDARDFAVTRGQTLQVRIPGQAIHLFQSKASTDSNRSHPVIPAERIQRFQREAIQFLAPVGIGGGHAGIG